MSNTVYPVNPHPVGGLEAVPNNSNQPAPEVYHPSTENAQILAHTQTYGTGHQQIYGQGHAPVDNLAPEPVRSSTDMPFKGSYGQLSQRPMPPTPPPTYKKICGVQPETFILALFLVLVVVIAAVAG